MGRVNPRIFAPATSREIEKQLRDGVMPTCFVRRMRVINLMSAAALEKIETDLFRPWDVMGIHHMLDEQISQDAIIDVIENDALVYALATGKLEPLWDVAQSQPLLLKAFHQGWIQRFFWTPMDPICIMLAMRMRLLLDLIDELGHSYNLIRMIGWGFIDLGEIPGEEPGDPGDYYDPGYDTPIEFPELPGPGEPGYVPGPGDPGYIGPAIPGPGEPGYVPGPGDPGYIGPPAPPGVAPMPGSVGYIPPGPGEPGYSEPGGDVGGAGGAMSAPSGLSSSPGDLGGAASPGGSVTPPYGDPCADVDDPEKTVSFSYTTQGMQVDETQEFAVTGNHPRWSYEAYEWKISGGGGSMTRDQEDPPDPIYGPEEEDYDPEARMFGLDVMLTAPADNAECAKSPTIELWCGGELMASLKIAVNAAGPGNAAYIRWDNLTCTSNDPFPSTCNVDERFYNCDDTEREGDFCQGGRTADFENPGCGTCYAKEDTDVCSFGYTSFNDIIEEAKRDLRTDSQITDGCCPEELL